MTLTRCELLDAARIGERYWLVIVEYALDPQQRIAYLICNPFGRIRDFRIESHWKPQAIRLNAADLACVRRTADAPPASASGGGQA